MSGKIWLTRKRRNALHATALIVGMLAQLAILGWLVFGLSGLVVMGAIGIMVLLLGFRLSTRMIIKMYCGRSLRREEAPALFELVDELSRNASLPREPKICYVPSQVVNAFSVGKREDAVIAVTDGLLQTLNVREITGVLAHEIAHIKDHDLRVMGLADFVSRATVGLSWFGQILLLLSLPLFLTGRYSIPWVLIVLLVLAPVLSALMQLALSRTREYDADLEAAALTRDPEGLASALAKMERVQGGILERIFLPGRRNPEPSLLRTHPATEERIRRLLEIEKEMAESRRIPEMLRHPDERFHWPVSEYRRPRWRSTGLWY